MYYYARLICKASVCKLFSDRGGSRYLKGGCLGSARLRTPGGGCGRGMCSLPPEARKLLDLHICRVQGGSFLDSILMLTTKIKIINNTTM